MNVRAAERLDDEGDESPQPAAAEVAVAVASPARSRAHWRSRFAARFFGVHVAAVAGVVWLGWSWTGLLLALGLYVVRMFFLTAGFHRYFSHRAFKTSRAMQLLLAIGGTLCVQKGVLWWASKHRLHHRHSDEPQDPHSPKQWGFWESHIGWVLQHEHSRTDFDRVKDLARFPELRWLDRHYLLPPLALAVVLLVTGGAFALFWGFLFSTVLLWHGTFTINSLSHLLGRRRYATSDDSRNNFALALITLGEGWHNNHHHYQSSANQGFRWWEVDLTYYGLKVMAWLGLIWDVRRAPADVVFASAATAVPARRDP
jgi:stearoyl-CoA desaturase (delta-9 desaturase)